MWVTNGRAFAPPCTACSIGVSTSANPRRTNASRTARTAVLRLSTTSRASSVDDQVQVALPHPGVRVGEPGVHVGQRAQALRGHPPGRHAHRQLAAPRGDHFSGDAHEVPEVDGVAEQPVRARVQVACIEHRLDGGTVLLQHGEDQPAEVAHRAHPADDADLRPGGGVRRQPGVAGDQRRDVVGARHADRVALLAGCGQQGELAAADRAPAGSGAGRAGRCGRTPAAARRPRRRTAAAARRARPDRPRSAHRGRRDRAGNPQRCRRPSRPG